ncbi:uncharacterized protein EAE97_009215 [Botrytis byssoidea]|uniref:Zinc finger PHD-type domain-containing protein n=1 Tax=Botrytis byssoidea TaxID=139641 RepID=A0A9P5IDC5_9HELO|nr:uncharacterized protein EAE97_009215 [Botrytis byssoidea]KAF7931006.1 hypothetical protein EAE97_009215 [Botrytis byssoidea]
MEFDSKQVAPTRSATNFDNNFRPQSFSSIKRNVGFQAQSDDKFDETSSTASLSTTSKAIKCLVCKREELVLDPLYRCSKCLARWHASCHKPRPPVGADVTDWYCNHCIRKHGLPPTEFSPERQSMGGVCEIPGCNKQIYSMLGKNKDDRVLCTLHEMTEKNKRSKLASKAQISAMSRPVSKPIKKTRLYPVKYDEDMQGMKRKRGRKPGDLKNKQILPSSFPIQSEFNYKPTTRPQETSNSEGPLSTLGPRPPRAENLSHSPHPKLRTIKVPNMNGSREVPKIPSRTIIQSMSELPSSPEYEPPPPGEVEDNLSCSPEYEPPSPEKVDSDVNIWQSDVEQLDIEQGDSPGSQIQDELRVMQESAKKAATVPADELVHGHGSPSLPALLSSSGRPLETVSASAENQNPEGKASLFDQKEVPEEKSSAASTTTPFLTTPLIRRPLKPISPKSNLDTTAQNMHFLNPESENGEVLCLVQKQKAETMVARKMAPSKQVLHHQQIINNAMNHFIPIQSPVNSRELEYTVSQLYQEGPNQERSNQQSPNQEELTHSAPLYGDYKPNTIEYQRQLRCLTYDPSVLDHYLDLQKKSQARAEVEKEQNIMPQSDNATETQIWGNIDPRVVWPKEQTESWYEAKRKEIDARGGKKANFGILLTAQVRKERADRGWHLNQNKEYVPKTDRKGGSIFVGDGDSRDNIDLAIRDGELGVLLPVTGRDRKKNFGKAISPKG